MPSTRHVAVAAAAAVWVGAGAVVVVWGQRMVADGTRLRLDVPPLHARWRESPAFGWGHLVAVVATVAALGLAPLAADRLRWSRAVAATALLALGWGVALNVTDGWQGGVLRGLESPSHEYPADVARVEDVGTFLRTYTERIDDYTTHSRGHPPGFVVLLVGLDRAAARTGVGFDGVERAALAAWVGSVLVVVAVAAAVRDVAGETTARRALPFVAVAPTALWMVTSADALYAGVTAVAVALVVLASSPDRDRRRRGALAVAAGAVAGAALLGSYGTVVAAAIPAVVVARRRAWGVAAGAAATAGAVLVAVGVVTGFWWLDGLETTRGEYHDGVASLRPYPYFVIANLVVLGLAVGPAAIAGLVTVRDRALGALLAGAGLAVAAANLSGMSKGEVERIWLPFAVWLLPAAAVLVRSRLDGWRTRGWLGAQAAVALGIQTFLLTGW